MEKELQKTDMFERLGFKIEKGIAIIFDKSPTDEDFIKAQELIENEYYRQVDKALKE